jgi:hypothetical protein
MRPACRSSFDVGGAQSQVGGARSQVGGSSDEGLGWKELLGESLASVASVSRKRESSASTTDAHDPHAVERLLAILGEESLWRATRGRVRACHGCALVRARPIHANFDHAAAASAGLHDTVRGRRARDVFRRERVCPCIGARFGVHGKRAAPARIVGGNVRLVVGCIVTAVSGVLNRNWVSQVWGRSAGAHVRGPVAEYVGFTGGRVRAAGTKTAFDEDDSARSGTRRGAPAGRRSERVRRHPIDGRRLARARVRITRERASAGGHHHAHQPQEKRPARPHPRSMRRAAREARTCRAPSSCATSCARFHSSESRQSS